MCLKLQRTYECENGNHRQEALIRCSDPIFILGGDITVSDQCCVLMPSVVEEYYDGPCHDCRGDTEGLPAQGSKLIMKRTYDPWQKIDPEMQDSEQLSLLKKENEADYGGPSMYYAHALAIWIYYIMTMDREPGDTEVETLPHYIQPDPERTPFENERAIWAERWISMLPEASCRIVPEHGPLEGLDFDYENNNPNEIFYMWGDGTCDCLAERQPMLNNPLSLVRREAATRMLNQMVTKIAQEDEGFVEDLYQHEMRYRERLAGMTEIFEKRKPAMKDYIKVVKPLTYQELQEQVMRHVWHFAPMMTHYCHNVKNFTTDWVRQMDSATYEIEARNCRERQHFIETLVINLVARDPGLSFERQKNIIHCFVKEFCPINPQLQLQHGIRIGETNYFFRLQHISVRDGRDNQKRMRKWVEEYAFASERGIQLHAVYQDTVNRWERHKKRHYDYVKYLETNIADATKFDIARLDEDNRACPICGDDLKELLEAKPIPGRRKKYLIPAQPRTCWMYKNEHWFCRSCLLRCALVREGPEKGYRWVKPRCPLCRKNFDPRENLRDEQQKKQEEVAERQRQAQQAAAAAAAAAPAAAQPALPAPPATPGPPGTPAPPAQPFQSPQPSPPRAPTLAQAEVQVQQPVTPQAQASNLVPSPASHSIAQMPSVLQLQAGQAVPAVQTTESVDSDFEMTDAGTNYASTEYDDNAGVDPFVVQPAAAGEPMDVDEPEGGDGDEPMEYF